tara:strand:+ start:36503 stop:36853 length:351 start_codon:yes stop_codon:yes gene_type:complete
MREHRDEMQDKSFSFIGKGCVISGKFSLKGTTHLASHLEGELIMEDDSRLTIEPEGSFEGRLQSHDVEIFGKFDGNLISTGTVIIHSCASVSGDLEASHLIVKPGATVNIEGRTLH